MKRLIVVTPLVALLACLSAAPKASRTGQPSEQRKPRHRRGKRLPGRSVIRRREPSPPKVRASPCAQPVPGTLPLAADAGTSGNVVGNAGSPIDLKAPPAVVGLSQGDVGTAVPRP